MAELVLTSGEIALIDDEDLPLVAGRRWFCFRSRGNYRYVVSGKSHALVLHRVITNAAPGMVVDHINGNVLDNRRSNLRVCTTAQNLANKKRKVTSKSPYKGICLDKRGNWRVAIGASYRRYRISGTFKCPIEAAAAYDLLAVLTYGEFACVNFPHVFPEFPLRKA